MKPSQVVIPNKRIAQKKRGRKAELAVRRILRKLPKTRFEVFNDVPARYGNIDHLVISREGAIFLIETKGHRGKVTAAHGKILLNGQPMRRDPVAQVSRNIKWLRSMIREKVGCAAWIVSILVFPNAMIYSPKGKRVLRLQPVHRMNVIGKGCLRKLIEAYILKSPRRMIWNRRADLFYD
jgi:hypothetical protein